MNSVTWTPTHPVNPLPGHRHIRWTPVPGHQTSGDLVFTWYIHKHIWRRRVQMKQTQTYMAILGSYETDTNLSGDLGFTRNKHKHIWRPWVHMKQTKHIWLPWVRNKQTRTFRATAGFYETDTNTSRYLRFTWKRHKHIWGQRVYMKQTQTQLGNLGFTWKRHTHIWGPRSHMKQTQIHLGTSALHGKDTNASGDHGQMDTTGDLGFKIWKTLKRIV